MDTTNFSEILQYGGIGLSAILIVALVWAIKYLVDSNDKRESALTTVICNHQNHQMESTNALTVAIEKLTTLIQERLK